MTKSAIKSVVASSGILRVSPTARFSRVLAAFERGPIDIQRDHEKRAPKARYLHERLSGAQLVFHLVMWEGKERLVDGYTRVQCIIEGHTEVPASVVIVLHNEPADLVALSALYDQFDSPSSQKRAGDRFDEGLRLTNRRGVYTSQLIARCQRSAPKLATAARNNREGVARAVDALDFVNSLGLLKVNETLGMMAGYLAVAKHADVYATQVEDFIRKLNQPVFAPVAPTKADRDVLLLRAHHEARKLQKTTTGGSNVIAIRNTVLHTFVRFLGLESRIPAGTGPVLTLAEFEAIMAKARSSK